MKIHCHWSISTARTAPKEGWALIVPLEAGGPDPALDIICQPPGCAQPWDLASTKELAACSSLCAAAAPPSQNGRSYPPSEKSLL